MRALGLAVSALGALALGASSCGSTTTCLIATCDGKCVDTTQDPDNCGACATRCTACTSSHCSLLLATTSDPVGFLTTDGENLYAAAPSTSYLGSGFDVVRISPSAGKTTRLVTADTGQIEGLATDGHSVYYTFLGTPAVTPGPDAVMQVPVGGGTPVTLASSTDTGTPVDSPGGVTVSGGNLYWSNGKGCPLTTCTPAIVTMPVAGGTATTLQGVSGSATAFDEPLAVGGSNLYFATHGATGGSSLFEAASDGAGAVAGVQAIGGTIDAAYAKPVNAVLTALAIDGNAVYWGSTGSDVWHPGKAPKPGAYTGVRFATPEDSAGGDEPTIGTVAGIALDASDVYWLYSPDPYLYQVWKAPRAGGTSSLLAQQGVPAKGYRPTSSGIVSLGSYVYWANGYDVYRTGK